FNGDLSCWQDDRPETFPFLLTGRDGANALAVVGADLMLVGGIKDGIMEAEDIAERIRRGMEHLISVSDGMFHHVYGRRIFRLGVRGDARRHQRAKHGPQRQPAYYGEDRSLLHGVSSFRLRMMSSIARQPIKHQGEYDKLSLAVLSTCDKRAYL